MSLPPWRGGVGILKALEQPLGFTHMTQAALLLPLFALGAPTNISPTAHHLSYPTMAILAYTTTLHLAQLKDHSKTNITAGTLKCFPANKPKQKAEQHEESQALTYINSSSVHCLDFSLLLLPLFSLSIARAGLDSPKAEILWIPLFCLGATH